MQKQKAHRYGTLLLTLALTVLVGAGSGLAADPINVAGKWTMTIAKQDTVAVGDAESHYFSLSRSVGTNVSTGANKFMDGAEAVNITFSDLVSGSGPNHGYSTLRHENITVCCRWEGRVTTMTVKDAPEVSFEGTFSWTGGTGQFADIRGTGTFKGHYASPTAYTVEWAGAYSLAK